MIPEDIKKFIKKYVHNINQRSETEKIKWKGLKMENYRRNWQYAITKEVLIIHEVIEPYDWNLDIQENPDFEIWQEQLKEKKDR
jgi:hypothetical protein